MGQPLQASEAFEEHDDGLRCRLNLISYGIALWSDSFLTLLQVGLCPGSGYVDEAIGSRYPSLKWKASSSPKRGSIQMKAME